MSERHVLHVAATVLLHTKKPTLAHRAPQSMLHVALVVPLEKKEAMVHKASWAVARVAAAKRQHRWASVVALR